MLNDGTEGILQSKPVTGVVVQSAEEHQCSNSDVQSVVTQMDGAGVDVERMDVGPVARGSEWRNRGYLGVDEYDAYVDGGRVVEKPGCLGKACNRLR